MIRQHQFTKVELVSITAPEKSKDEHERMLAQRRGSAAPARPAYRVVTLCTGDMGFASQKTYDIEVWLPGRGCIARSRPARTAATSRRAAWTRASRGKENRTPRFVHTLKRLRDSRRRAPDRRDGDLFSSKAAASRCRMCCQRYMGGMQVVERGELGSSEEGE